MDVSRIRTSTGYGWLAALMLMAFTTNVCLASTNPLIGSWKWDNEKTLNNFRLPVDGSDELKASALNAQRTIEGNAKNLHMVMVVTYRDGEYEQVMRDNSGLEFSRTVAPYRVVEITKDAIIIDQFNNGGLIKQFFDGNDSFYVQVKVGEFTFKDYFTKLN